MINPDGHYSAGGVKKLLDETLSEALVVHYRDTRDTQQLVDAIQRQLRCCGMTSRNFRDWNLNM